MFRKNEKNGLILYIVLMSILIISGICTLMGYLTNKTTIGTITDVSEYKSQAPKTFNRDKTKVTVTYTVDGKVYTTKFTESGKTKNYIKGSEIEIYYNPKDPSRAFATPELGKLWVIGGFILLGGFYILLYKRKKDGEI